FFFQAEDGIRGDLVTGVQTCALPILKCSGTSGPSRSPIQPVSRSSSSSESFSPGISSVVISNHTLVSRFRYSSVSSTGASAPPRSEERRVGKEGGRESGGAEHINKRR